MIEAGERLILMELGGGLPHAFEICSRVGNRGLSGHAVCAVGSCSVRKDRATFFANILSKENVDSVPPKLSY